MMMCEALTIIDELLDSGWYSKPSYYAGIKRTKESTMMHKSFQRWALTELGTFLSSCPNQDPIFLIEKYREAMNHKACEGKTEEFRYTFGVLYEVATEVLDLLLVR